MSEVNTRPIAFWLREAAAGDPEILAEVLRTRLLADLRAFSAREGVVALAPEQEIICKVSGRMQQKPPMVKIEATYRIETIDFIHPKITVTRAE